MFPQFILLIFFSTTRSEYITGTPGSSELFLTQKRELMEMEVDTNTYCFISKKRELYGVQRYNQIVMLYFNI